ncbi:hypothetical protein F3Y22_tig00113722pilonHSYRG00291 [Hibiscus syriacus]|uniref:Uncharacterized protein n=1 Tax=Hibiscus syriacus TaxID=106335 RepID=A0A6A2XU79_HIBSY|nr:hypothetical protein F3Y22_tig00113722pilonHSYRG00291 [Hibiscus syriacus]
MRFWWVGENLMPPQENREWDEKDIVNETLKIYEEKGLIQPVLKKNILEPRSYKMDSIVRSCLISFTEEAGFFKYDQEGKPTMDFSAFNKTCMVRSEVAVALWFSKYLKGSDKDEESEKPKDKQFLGLPKEWLAKMTTLKVLYMGKWETTAGRPRHIEVEDIDFLKALKKMKNLRLLSLQGVSGIPKILDAVPRKLSELKKLEVLKGFVIVDTKNSCTLGDLSKLEKLRKLSINVNTTNFNINDAEESLLPPEAKKQQAPSSLATDQDNRMGPLDVFRNTVNKVLEDNANQKTTNEEDSNKKNGGVVKNSVVKNWLEVVAAVLGKSGNKQLELKGGNCRFDVK